METCSSRSSREIMSKSIIASKKAKIRNRYSQVPHLTQDTSWESADTRKHHIYVQESQQVSPFPAGEHKAAMNGQETHEKHETLITKMIHKRSQLCDFLE